jgi:FKBP-type peptidyl-prolyl cis-trans isomerase 2
MRTGDFIRIRYTGKVKESGEVFDTTSSSVAKKAGIFNPKFSYGPVPVIVGAGKVVPGLDKAIIEMRVGEKKKVEIEPEMGFGERRADLIKIIPEREFRRRDIVPFPGMFVNLGNVRGRVLSVSSGRVKVDLNHPLAGKTLLYDIEVMEKITGTENKVKAVVEFYTRMSPKVKVMKRDIEISHSGEIRSDIKKAISDDIMKYIKNVDRVRFAEVFEKDLSGKKAKNQKV